MFTRNHLYVVVIASAFMSLGSLSSCDRPPAPQAPTPISIPAPTTGALHPPTTTIPPVIVPTGPATPAPAPAPPSADWKADIFKKSGQGGW